jgi:hypothetical protein
MCKLKLNMVLIEKLSKVRTWANSVGNRRGSGMLARTVTH